MMVEVEDGLLYESQVARDPGSFGDWVSPRNIRIGLNWI
jgi:hypothetical protein